MKKIIIIILLLIMPIIIYAQTCDNSKIKIESIELSNKNGSAEEINNVGISDGKINLDLKLYEVNDSIEYNIKVKNESSEEIKIDKNSLINSSDYVTYTFSSDSIKPNEEKIINLKVEYKNEVPLVNLVENSFSDNKSVVVNLVNKEENIVNPKTGRMTLLYVIMLIDVSLLVYIFANKQTSIKQISIIIISLLVVPNILNASCSYNLEVDSKIVLSSKEAIFDIGQNVNIKMKQLAGDDIGTDSFKFADLKIKSIKKSNIEPSESNKTSDHIVSAEYSYYPIYMWFDTDTIYWWSEDITPVLNSDSTAFCYVMTELIDISGLETFNSSAVIKMKAMFGSETSASLKLSNILPLKDWDTSNATDMSYLFYRCTNIIDISALSNWNTSKVTNMDYLLSNNYVLTNLNSLSNWNTSNVTSMRGVFYKSTALESLHGLENWDTSKLTDMKYIFYGCSNLTDISALSNWKTLNVKDMSFLFHRCSKLANVSALSNWDTSNVTDMSYLFYYCPELSNISGLSNWKTSNVTNMQFLLHGCSKVANISALSNWDTSNVTNMEYLLANNSVLSDLSPLSNWNTSNVTTMGSMLRNCSSVTSLHGLENWDVSKVMNFSEGNDNNNAHSEGAFQGMTSLSDASAINNWNINRSAYFNNMFKGTPVHPTFSKMVGTWDSEGTFVPE